ncbi:MAG: hypothetical protein ACP5SI_10785 [Chloroflexia bacterium]
MTDERVNWETISPREMVARLRARVAWGEAVDLEPFRVALERPEVAEEALALLADLFTQEAWDLLEKVAETNRALRKAARRAQHRMRTRGFRPQEKRAPARPKVVRVLATSFNELGEQILRVVQEAPLGMLRSVNVLLSAKGIEGITTLTANREDLQKMFSEFEQSSAEMPGFLVEVNLPYVARRVWGAAARMREAGRPLPYNYQEVEELFVGVPEDPWPAELDEDLSRPSPDEADRLLREAIFAPWHLREEKLQPFAKEWFKITEAIPPLTEDNLPNLAFVQARGQMTARIIETMFDAATCSRFREQLQEEARLYLFFGRADLARLAARCAREFDTVPLAENTFLRTLVERSMDAVLLMIANREEEEREPWKKIEEAGGLWVPRPAPPEEGEKAAKSSLWVPGMDL